ncbi:Putative uncharacterized protein [Taphrina deformans PYCC 5710]|uniref:Stress response RCI peptide n=1 Tax=Taphrina deformans (strain PYCC 5710 / ATCC 11124 / CBS 356.35 / IMI 108563 / JCM 9778 / NBRC 8474) TaxID=1097556 RepID=R4XG17_TAPDE|nr:Putative uncharacterized protein [Taphrina deformans PYCC 5710]|eukprot:CCG82329.1 Putative uncharacterized protein [Taphrina deformans PYCC 5710]
MSAGDILLLIMAVILPPLPVAIKRGLCSGAFWLNLLLSVLAYIPGMIHAWYIVLKYPDHIHSADCRHGQRDLERNPTTGTFPGQVYQAHPQPRVQQSHQPQAGGNMDGVYGGGGDAQQGQQRLLSAGGKNYGAASTGQQPPAYSPVDAKDQSRA